MKRLYFIAALSVATLAAHAQEKLTLSTYNGTNVARYDGHICNITVNRYVFTGWNTIALPFDITATELNELFGADCRLERLTAAETVDGNMILFFQDCKAEGLKANIPYLLHYTGATGNKTISKHATISDDAQTLSVSTRQGERVTMGGIKEKTTGIGLYGILARDNAEAKFARVDGSLSGFLATRCFVQMPDGFKGQVISRHIAAGEVTAIENIANNPEKVNIYNTKGMKVAKDMKNLKPGMYLVNGQKVLVK